MAGTEQAIIDATWRCIQRLGPRRTTIAEVAREAGLARGTVYQYFPDKAKLLDAVVRWTSAEFLRGMAIAMADGRTFEQQLTLAAAFVAERHDDLERARAAWGPDRVAAGLLQYGEYFLEESARFLEPYLAAAAARGELREDIDVSLATEWCSRALTSLFTMPSARLDLADPLAVGSFVATFAVGGLGRPTPRSQAEALSTFRARGAR